MFKADFHRLSGTQAPFILQSLSSKALKFSPFQVAKRGVLRDLVKVQTGRFLWTKATSEAHHFGHILLVTDQARGHTQLQGRLGNGVQLRL